MDEKNQLEKKRSIDSTEMYDRESHCRLSHSDGHPRQECNQPFVAVLLALSMSAPAPSFAQSSSASFELPRQSIDSGTAASGSAAFSLRGTLGQADVGELASSATFQLSGGFHRGGSRPREDSLFSDRFEGAPSTRSGSKRNGE